MPNLGQLTQVADPLGGLTTFTYDPDGNLLTATDPLQNQMPTPARTFYTYDDLDWVMARQDPLGSTETYDVYDLNGNLTHIYRS